MLCWLVFLGLIGRGFVFPTHAEEPEAQHAFNNAVKLFQGGWYDQSEKEFAAFLTSFANSTNRNQAVLLQAQSRFQLKDFSGVIALLESQMAAAGPQKDQFWSWLAQAHFQLDHFEAAANACAELLKDAPESPLRLEASYTEAFARLKLGDTARTVQLLQPPTSAFQLAAQIRSNDVVVVRGHFLLAEALLAQKNFPVAAQTLTALAQRGLSAEAEWQRQYLLARIEMGDWRGAAALARITNLVALSVSTSNATLHARSLALKGEILEDQEPDAAAQAYEDIAKVPNLPPDQKRQGLLKLVELAIAQNRLTNAIGRLESFLRLNPQEPASDLIRLTLGEIYLKQFYTLRSSSSATNSAASIALSTNLLYLARSQFEPILFWTNSPYLGKAHLDRGWCFWEEAQLLGDTNKLVETQKALNSAIASLPQSMDRAQALFKLGDVHFRLKDYTNALLTYRRLVSDYSDLPEAREKVLDHALYQIVRASIEVGDLAGGTNALQQILTEFPASPWGDDALFVYGQAWMDAGEFARARDAFADFEKRFPQSPLVPQVRLAVARSFLRQSEWLAAIQRYDLWLTQFTNHVSQPQAEFDRAWCYYQAGSGTNALVLFSNLVRRFPASDCRPLAQLWIGDYYLNQRGYDDAEANYQLLFQSTNSVPPELARHAVVMAAKAAFFRQDYSEARRYLTNDLTLLNDPKVGPEAWFMLGDIELMSTNKLRKFEEAINRFQRVAKLDPSNRLVPLAVGKIANCHFQLAAESPNRYEQATNLYWQVISSPLADVPTRSQAEVALGQVLEKMSEHWTNRTDLLSTALGHYLNVVNGKRLHPEKGEEPDPFWLSKAALAAGKLAVDRLQQFDQAEKLYLSMIKTMPSLRADWEKKLESLRRQQAPK